jgi:hypothetical protein
MTTLFYFLVEEGLFVRLPGPPLFLDSRGLLLFTSIIAVDVTSMLHGLDLYFSLNSLFHYAYK